MSPSTILLTGAAGYIGSHTWVALLRAGVRVVGLDNFANSSARVLDQVAGIAGQPIEFVEADVVDRGALHSVFERHRIDAVVHLAALKAVAESARQPLDYYWCNIAGLLSLTRAMQQHRCHRIVFSSSATVYGAPDRLPIDEDAPLAPASPYGSTKRMGETVLADLERAQPMWRSAVLRYFNPIGAHPSGRIGEDPRGTPNNLLPYLAQVAVGRLPALQVFGADYPTRDGTGVRDYIHVCDLADGHVAALRHLLDGGPSLTVNLGTGSGWTVLEVLRAYEKASGRTIPYRIAPRRAGDVAATYADPRRAATLLGWRARLGLDAMCADSWRWQSRHPLGFGT